MDKELKAPFLPPIEVFATDEEIAVMTDKKIPVLSEIEVSHELLSLLTTFRLSRKSSIQHYKR